MASRERPEPQEVLAWMAANGAGLGRASKHFGVSESTIQGWRNRARTNPEVVPPSSSRTPTLQVFTTPAPPAAPKLPKSMSAKVRKVLHAYLDHLLDAEVIAEASARDSVAVIAGCLDRLELASGATKKAAPVADPTTDTGREALMAELLALPAELIHEAAKRAAGG